MMEKLKFRLVIGMLYAFSLLPRPVGIFLFRAAGRLVLELLPAFSRRVTNAARLILGSKDKLDPARSMDNITTIMAELIYFMKARRRARIQEFVTIKDEEILRAAVARGRGVIGLSAHLGNFFIMGTGLQQAGYAFTYIIREPSDPWLSDTIKFLMPRYDLDYVYVGRGNLFLRGILQRLKQGKIVAFVVDEDKGEGGVEVEFFGHHVTTAAGPAVIAKRTGAPIVPMFCVRTGDHYTIHLDQEITFDDKAPDPIRACVAAYTKVVEKYIRLFPDQWMWHNTRFRGQI